MNYIVLNRNASDYLEERLLWICCVDETSRWLKNNVL